MKKTLIAISTFKKNAAIDGIIGSLLQYGYIRSETHLLICDDNNGEAEEIFNKYLPLIPSKISYTTGPNKGIWANKNRGIKFFLENDFENLILMDDDIVFDKYGLIEEFEAAAASTGYKHICTWLRGSNVFTVFPPVHEDDNVIWANGSQGMCSFYTRDLMEAVGYHTIDWKSKYGFEHAELTARCNRKMGFNPELCASLRRSDKYFQCQGIPNNYTADFKPNEEMYAYKLLAVYGGHGLTNMKHGLSKKERLI